jgi:glucose-6-phosphate 1-dehydrogenase
MSRYFAIFGASGDLASRHLLTTLAQLRLTHKLEVDVQIIGIAPEDWDPAFFRASVRGRLKIHAPEVLDVWSDYLSARTEYRKADVTKPEQVRAALASLQEPAVLIWPCRSRFCWPPRSPLSLRKFPLAAVS